MIYSDYLRDEMQSTKWDRMRIDYNLVEQVIRAKELSNTTTTKESNIKVRTINENKS